MISWHAISRRIVEKSAIDWSGNEKERDLCVYSFELLLSNLFNFALILSLCILFKIQQECLLFLLFYCPIRFFAGGGHAPNHISCVAIFYLYMHGSILLCNYLIMQVPVKWLLLLAGIFFALCLGINIKYAAFHKEAKQKARHRKITAAIFLTDVFIIAFCLYQGFYYPVIMAALAFTLESVMLLPFIYKPPVLQAVSMAKPQAAQQATGQ